MKFGERLKLSPNISNAYQIAGIPQTIMCDRIGEEEILPFQLLFKCISARNTAKEIPVLHLTPVLKTVSAVTFS